MKTRAELIEEIVGAKREEYRAKKRAWYKRNIVKQRIRKAKNARDWRKNNPEKVKESDSRHHKMHKVKERESARIWNLKNKNNPDFKAKRNQRRLRHYYLNKDKELSRGKLVKSVIGRKIVRPSHCESCKNKRKVEGHHHDYSKALEVTWLCKECHEKLHPAARAASTEKRAEFTKTN